MYSNIIIFLTTIGFLFHAEATEKFNLTEIYKELKQVSEQNDLSDESWQGFLKKVDNLCEQDQNYCEFYYMIESSVLMFEKDEYSDNGQCERTENNVKDYFRSSLPAQKGQVLNVVKKLCAKAQERLNKN